ncbi:MAG TPA: MFS transporter [Thermodesulfobacteriota bacterium]|nr:MFS transporter [Thermodesulfobacteriota bacterium]
MTLIIALRLLGIFLVIPIFSVYAINYPGATLPLVGIAFGIYAFIQSFLHIPFGWASDRFGRKPVLLIGLFLFVAGSVVCGMAENINQLIFARILQGSGAVSAVAMAALGDLTRSEVRAQAFTISGIIVGVVFIFGLLGGPLLASHFGFHNLFYVLAALGFLAILTAGFFFPEGETNAPKGSGFRIREVISHIEIQRLYIATFVLSFIINIFFFIYPLSWTQIGLERSQLWKVYLVVFLPIGLIVFPYIRYAEKQDKLLQAGWLGWVFMVLGFLLYILGGNKNGVLYTTGGSFFLGFTVFQSLLPAFLTQRVPFRIRGAATGFYNLASFFGASLGGMLAGILYNLSHILPLIFSLVLLIGWLLVGLPKPPDSSAESEDQRSEVRSQKSEGGLTSP